MNSNNTPEENFRLHGKLSDTQIISFLDLAQRKQKTDGTELQDALSPVGEDFLAPVISELRNIADKMRKGDSKDRVLRLLESIDDLSQLTCNAVDYSNSIIRDVMVKLKT